MSFSNKILKWYDQHGRKNLPWQQDITPYKVWISEIMLQQTQVTTVIPYFEKFMQSFPDVATLAKASTDEVLHHWSGLGYYSRAKNLHKTAQIIHNEHKGVFPDTVDALSELPGIGRSTAAAIVSIAFVKPAAILDGNVKRVLARHEAIAGWPGTSKTLKELWAVAEALAPNKRPNHYSQAMMDLGATLCTRTKPQCESCPVQKSCKAFAQGNQTDYPGKKPKKTLPVKSTCMLVLRHNDDILLYQRPLTGLWPGLWSLPEIDSTEDFGNYQNQHLPNHVVETEHLEGFRHTFSHFHLDISILHVCLKQKPLSVMEDQQQLWYNTQTPSEVGLAAPVSKILKRVS